MSFDGSLVKFGVDEFPLQYVVSESYSVTPNMRQDLDSSRSATGYLNRNVLKHTASKITLKTRKLDNTQVAALTSFIRSHYSIELERKLVITYYCPDIDDYKTGEFYYADVEFPIHHIDYSAKRIYYNSIELKFVEY